MSGFHWHRDRDWQLRNVHRYYECRCGARRVQRAFQNLCGPVEPGWPRMTDRHGYPIDDSGWVKDVPT